MLPRGESVDMASSLFLSALSPRSGRELLFSVVVAGLFFAPAVLMPAVPRVPVWPSKWTRWDTRCMAPRSRWSAPPPNLRSKAFQRQCCGFQGQAAARRGRCEHRRPCAGSGLLQTAREGTYYLEVPGVGRSWNFLIGPNVFERTYYMAMRGFYGQRCGTAVDMGPEFPGYSHPACHQHGEFHASSGAKGPGTT